MAAEAVAPVFPNSDDSPKNRRYSRSFNPVQTNTKRLSRAFTTLPVTKTYSNPSVRSQRTETDLSSINDIKSECFQWGGGKKILERPKLLRGKSIKLICAGGNHFLSLLEDGSVYTWGEGRCGQLGVGIETKNLEQPRKIEELPPIKNIYAGLTQSAFVSVTNEFFICGLIGKDLISQPTKAPAFDNVIINCVSFGPSCISVLGCTTTEDYLTKKKISAPPVVWVWGHSRRGHLGMGERFTIEEPCELEYLSSKNVIQLSSGEYHMCAVTKDEEVYIWGECDANGTGVEGKLLVPTKVLGLEAKGAIKVICGSKSTFVLTKSGNVFSWGSGRYGILGHGKTENYEFPGMITALNDKHIIGLDSGGIHTCAWTNDGRVYSWGYGKSFALGHPDGNDRHSPTLIEVLADGKILLDLSCSSNDTVALIERDMVEVTFKNQCSRLPVHNYPFVGHILRKMATHHKRRAEDLFLLDSSGLQLEAGNSIRDIKSSGNKTLQLVAKPSMYDYTSDTLIFFPPDKERIKKGCDAIPLVKGGSIQSLIEWLTFSKSTGDFVNTFLLTYRTFMTSSEFLKLLIIRFKKPIVRIDEIESFDIIGYVGPTIQERENIIRARVLNTIKRWLSNYADNFIGQDVSDVINIIKKFIEGNESRVRTSYERDCANIIRYTELLLHKEEKIYEIKQFKEKHCPQLTQPNHNLSWDIFKYPPEEIARQMTLIDFFLYFCKIQSGELIGQAWSKSNKEIFAPNVLNMIRRFNEVSEWVAKLILTGRTQAIRSAITEQFIEIANELFKINSFNSVMSILSAFNTSSLHRLKSVWDPKNGGISTISLATLRKLQKALSVEKNMSSFRDYFDSLPSPKIPFLGKYLQDLTFIDDGNPNFIDDNENIINFDKRTKLASIISVIKQLQKHPYQFIEIPECIVELQKISGFGENNESLAYATSKYIESKSGEITNDISDIDNPQVREILIDLPVIQRKSKGTITTIEYNKLKI